MPFTTFRNRWEFLIYATLSWKQLQRNYRFAVVYLCHLIPYKYQHILHAVLNIAILMQIKNQEIRIVFVLLLWTSVRIVLQEFVYFIRIVYCHKFKHWTLPSHVIAPWPIVHFVYISFWLWSVASVAKETYKMFDVKYVSTYFSQRLLLTN